MSQPTRTRSFWKGARIALLIIFAMVAGLWLIFRTLPVVRVQLGLDEAIILILAILALASVFFILRRTARIRVRLALSYAGIALFVTLALGAVLLFRLRGYYARMELDYLTNNAKAISALALPMLEKQYPQDIQEAQVSNLAFLSQTRVRILDTQMNALADSGPWQSPQIGFGVVRDTKRIITLNGAKAASPSSVIIVQKENMNGGTSSNTIVSARPHPDNELSAAGPPDNLPNTFYFSSAGPVSNGVYGLYLSKPSSGLAARSSQMVLEPIIGSASNILGYVELSESPAYGREIVNSVASGLAVAGGLAILLAIGAGWLTSRWLAAPLSHLTEATLQMSSGDLTVRVVEANRPDEFGVLGKSFNQMAGRIEETVQTLRRFLSDAAHELQTPLTALRTNLELAKSEANNPATGYYLGQALEQIERLQHLIHDLLSLSRLESAYHQDAFQRVDLVDLVRRVSEPFAARAEQANQTFELDLPEQPDLTETLGGWSVMGNQEKLCSALSNLLDNALKFTPAGGSITVHLRKEKEFFCLVVSDTGIGIPPEETAALFNRFHRAKNASAYPGSGLGLAIVRAIALAHAGSVHANNNPQGGASFELFLPCAVRDPHLN